MKKLLMVLGMSLTFSGVALARPNVVKKAKCVACHTEAVGKKTNVSKESLDMLKKYPGQKCADCHAASDDGKKLTCTNEKVCKK